MSETKIPPLYDDNNNGWKTVTNGLKIKKESKKNVNSISAKANTNQLVGNPFALPKHLEKKLHLNSAINAMFQDSNNNINNKKSTNEQSNKNLRCHKRNQRRNEKRRRKNMMKKKTTSNIRPPLSTEIDNVVVEFEKLTNVLCLPPEIWDDNIAHFLSISDLASFRICNKQSKSLSDSHQHWQQRFKSSFPSHSLEFQSDYDYKLAFKLHTSNGTLDKNRCSLSKKTFFEDIVGIGLNYTINPKTKNVDYISAGQDLLSASAFKAGKKEDAFGNKFQLFLPLFFSKDHLDRSMPLLMSTIIKLCPEKSSYTFKPCMVLDVLPKIINTFSVLVSDEGVAASNKSFIGLIRIHRLFLALAKKFPSIKKEAISRIQQFKIRRSKSSCPSLGNFLPLLMIVDEEDCSWTQIRSNYISESLTRSVLWICKKYPQLERSHDLSAERADERLQLTREAAQVGMRLNMLQVHFTSFLCQGPNSLRAVRLDNYLESEQGNEGISAQQTLNSQEEGDGTDSETENQSVAETTIAGQGENLSYSSELKFLTFRSIVNDILCVNSWPLYFKFMRAPCPSKNKMCAILRSAVKESARQKYHTPGMDFSKVHASGTSSILSKGQQYSAEARLQQVVFQDSWTFDGNTKFLDATCLVYKGKKLVETIDYSRTIDKKRAIVHSGDIMIENTGSHTIQLDLSRIDGDTCIFVLSAYMEATLFEIKSASISFYDASTHGRGSASLCTYNLDAHDKISHLKSIIVCKLYKTSQDHWHVLAIGDSHKGSADNYGPIYTAAAKYL